MRTSLRQFRGRFGLEPADELVQFHRTGIGTFPPDRNGALCDFFLADNRKHGYAQEGNLPDPLAEAFVPALNGGTNI